MAMLNNQMVYVALNSQKGGLSHTPQAAALLTTWIFRDRVTPLVVAGSSSDDMTSQRQRDPQKSFLFFGTIC